MATIAIALKHIMIDPDLPVELTALPEQEAIRLIKEAYGFLGPFLDVSIQEGVAVITLPDEKAQRVDDALKIFDRALRTAQRGEYKRAIQQFHQVLAVLPGHAVARRNLGMAYEEMGDVESAKDHIIEALKLDPKDAWSYVLLGNIYMKREKNYDRADKLYRRALELTPNDAMLLANYGALMAEKGNAEQAAEFFERAIQANPQYPHAYYSLGLLAMREGRPEEAIATLDDMFAKSQSSDLRSGPVYDNARRLYLEVSRQAAEASAARLMGFVEARRRTLEEQGEYPIEVVEDRSLELSGETQMAWAHHRDRHIVRYRTKAAGIAPHLVAHELEHIALEQEARQAGRNRIFTTTAATTDLAMSQIGDHAHKMKGMGLPEDLIAQYTARVVTGLANQLFNAPLDMVIEQRLHQGYEVLRPSQFVSVCAIYAEALPALTDKEIRKMSPPLIYRASVTLNCAYALMLDHLYEGKTAYAEPYRAHKAFDTAQRLFGLWREAMDRFNPGDEYALVDEFARVLRLERWYEWRPDRAAPSLAFDRGGERLDLPMVDGPTNVELLDEKQPAAMMYCLNALRRFEGMDDTQVSEVTSEIALMGRFGLDYASSEQKYALKSVPGEKFSGLQLLCLMYVGFQRIDPAVDLELPLHDAYTMALAMYNAGKDN